MQNFVEIVWRILARPTSFLLKHNTPLDLVEGTLVGHFVIKFNLSLYIYYDLAFRFYLIQGKIKKVTKQGQDCSLVWWVWCTTNQGTKSQ